MITSFCSAKYSSLPCSSTGKDLWLACSVVDSFLDIIKTSKCGTPNSTQIWRKCTDLLGIIGYSAVCQPKNQLWRVNRSIHRFRIGVYSLNDPRYPLLARLLPNPSQFSVLALASQTLNKHEWFPCKSEFFQFFQIWYSPVTRLRLIEWWRSYVPKVIFSIL